MVFRLGGYTACIESVFRRVAVVKGAGRKNAAHTGLEAARRRDLNMMGGGRSRALLARHSNR